MKLRNEQYILPAIKGLRLIISNVLEHGGSLDELTHSEQ